MAKTRLPPSQQQRGRKPAPAKPSSKGRSQLDELISDSDIEIDDGMLKVQGGGAGADSSDELADAAVYALDDSEEDGSEEEAEDDDDLLEEALLRGGKQAQRE
jgi:hypothetical protein